MATTMTRKGQVTIPKPVRDHLGLGPGSGVEFALQPDGRVTVLPAPGTRRAGPGRFAKLRASATAGLSTDAIMALTRSR